MSSSEWREVKLGEVCGIGSSKRIFASEYTSDGVAFFRSKEIIEKAKGEKISTNLYISENRFYEIESQYGTPQTGDILLTSVGTLGVPYLVRDERFYFKDGNLTWFKDFNDELVSVFLYYWFLSKYGKHQIDTKSIGSTQKALTIDTLKKFDINLPPLQEQKAIAQILSTLDEKIETNNKINKTLEEMAEAIFKHWFVDFEFPNEDGEPYKSSGGEMVDSELGPIPNGWEVKEADEIANINIGKTPPRAIKECFSYDPNDIKWISIKDLGNSGVYIFESSEYLKADAIERYNVKVVPDSSVVLSFKLTVGRVAITVGEMTTNEAIAHFNIESGSQLSKEYLYLYLSQFDYESLGNTSSIARAVNSKIIKSMNILLPDRSRLREFSKLVNPVFEMIKEKSQETIELKSIRDTLLPKLMSGEIRVPIDNE
ncbi:MAG: restriction endonuclease subunit S [Gudongella sp.]|jgi:type I restriction enzyme S subunit|nr:restriction endonuclease subunit S [Gudongella sp.]